MHIAEYEVTLRGGIDVLKNRYEKDQKSELLLHKCDESSSTWKIPNALAKNWKTLMFWKPKQCFIICEKWFGIENYKNWPILKGIYIRNQFFKF